MYEQFEEMDDQDAVMKFYQRKLVGSLDLRQLVSFLIREFSISRGQAESLGNGDVTFLLEMLSGWNDEANRRQEVLDAVAERHSSRLLDLDNPTLNADRRCQGEAFIAASCRGGLWGQIPVSGKGGRPEEAAKVEWVECTQADLLRANNLEPKRAGYAETLRAEGILTEFEKKSEKGGITRVVFGDTPEGRAMKDRVLKLKAEATGRRRRPKG